jgi:hypothetical protein
MWAFKGLNFSHPRFTISFTLYLPKAKRKEKKICYIRLAWLLQQDN